jgi:hypothetical protein
MKHFNNNSLFINREIWTRLSKYKVAATEEELEQYSALLEELFNNYWNMLPDSIIETMVKTSTMVGNRVLFQNGEKVIPYDDREAFNLRHRLIRDNFGTFFKTRQLGRILRDRDIKLALAGELGETAEFRQGAKRLALALQKRDAKDVWDACSLIDVSAWRLGYEAACQLRSAGQLDFAYNLFRVFGSHMSIMLDDMLPLPPYQARGGIPLLFEEPGSGGGIRLLSSHVTIPNIDFFDWRIADHVIGCGTTVTFEMLDMLEVPKWKQHIIEVHRSDCFVVGTALPHLKGRVIIVDDIHEGETSLNLARVYRGNTVNISNFRATRFFDGPQPLADIDVPEIIEQLAG